MPLSLRGNPVGQVTRYSSSETTPQGSRSTLNYAKERRNNCPFNEIICFSFSEFSPPLVYFFKLPWGSVGSACFLTQIGKHFSFILSFLCSLAWAEIRFSWNFRTLFFPWRSLPCHAPSCLPHGWPAYLTQIVYDMLSGFLDLPLPDRYQDLEPFSPGAFLLTF